MQINYNIAMEVASHEAIVRQAYKNDGDVWTWSVGLTSATGHMVERYIGKPQSLEHCLRVYVWALDNYAEAVRRTFKDIPLTEAQFAGILSWTWNLGEGALASATWVKHFKAGRMKEAERSFKSWNKAGGKVSEGLKDRRQKEADLIWRGIWSNKGKMLEYTRVKSSGTIDWGSGKMIDVERQLKAALVGEVPASDKVIVSEPVVPEKVEKAVKKETNFWGWLTTILGSGGAGLAGLLGASWQTILAIGGVGVIGILIIILLGPALAKSIKKIRAEVEA